MWWLSTPGNLCLKEAAMSDKCDCDAANHCQVIHFIFSLSTEKTRTNTDNRIWLLSAVMHVVKLTEVVKHSESTVALKEKKKTTSLIKYHTFSLGVCDHSNDRRRKVGLNEGKNSAGSHSTPAIRKGKINPPWPALTSAAGICSRTFCDFGPEPNNLQPGSPNSCRNREQLAEVEVLLLWLQCRTRRSPVPFPGRGPSWRYSSPLLLAFISFDLLHCATCQIARPPWKHQYRQPELDQCDTIWSCYGRLLRQDLEQSGLVITSLRLSGGFRSNARLAQGTFRLVTQQFKVSRTAPRPNSREIMWPGLLICTRRHW